MLSVAGWVQYVWLAVAVALLVIVPRFVTADEFSLANNRTLDGQSIGDAGAYLLIEGRGLRIVEKSRIRMMKVYFQHPGGQGLFLRTEPEPLAERLSDDLLEPLRIGLRDKDPAVRTIAAATLGELGRRASGCVNDLVRVIREDKHTTVLTRAIEAIGRMGPDAKPAVPHVMSLLGAEKAKGLESPQCMAAIVALGNIGPDAADSVSLLIECSGYVWTRTDYGSPADAAVTSLRRIGPVAMPTLIEALKGPSEGVARSAARVLATFGRKAHAAVPALINGYKKYRGWDGKQHDKSVVVIDEVAFACLGQVAEPSPQVLAFMIRAFNAIAGGSDARARGMAVDAMVSLGSAAAPGLVRAWDGSSGLGHRAIVDALVRLAPDSLPHCIDALSEAGVSRGARANLLEVLARLGPLCATALPQVVGLLASDEDEHVRRQAVRAIGGMSSLAKPALPALGRALLEDESPLVRLDAANTLGQLAVIAATQSPALIKALQDDDKGVRQAATRALRRLEGR